MDAGIIFAFCLGFALTVTLLAIVIYVPFRLILGPQPKLQRAALIASVLVWVAQFFWNAILLTWLRNHP